MLVWEVGRANTLVFSLWTKKPRSGSDGENCASPRDHGHWVACSEWMGHLDISIEESRSLYSVWEEGVMWIFVGQKGWLWQRPLAVPPLKQDFLVPEPLHLKFPLTWLTIPRSLHQSLNTIYMKTVTFSYSDICLYSYVVSSVRPVLTTKAKRPSPWTLSNPLLFYFLSSIYSYLKLLHVFSPLLVYYMFPLTRI